MRAISPNKRYSIVLFGEESGLVVDDHGQAHSIVKNPAVVAWFEPSGVFPSEEKEVLEKLSFTGLAEGVNPMQSIGVYDTDAQAKAHGWSPEFHEKVKAELRRKAELFPNNILCIEEQLTPKPWGKYDEMEAEEILEYAQNLELDYEKIRRYEAENLGRPELLSALQDLEDQAASGEVVVEA